MTLAVALTGPLEVSLLLMDQKPYYPIWPVSAIKQGDPAGGSNEPQQLKGQRSGVLRPGVTDLKSLGI